MEHFLITRFNLVKDDWKEDRNSQEVLNEEWLTNRIKLFKKICLPSVIGQTTKNFKWLIFFEKKSENEISNLIQGLDNYSFIEPILVDGYREFQSGLSRIIQKRVSKSSQYILTTRLDNDDGLNKNFMLELQKAVNIPKHNQVLHFPRGLFLDLNAKNKLASCYYPLNQFVSLLEDRKKEFKTVFCKEHDKWDRGFRIHPLNLQDAWLQVTHGNNMANQFKGDLVFSRRLKNVTVKKVPFTMGYNFKVIYQRFNIEKVKRKLLKR